MPCFDKGLFFPVQFDLDVWKHTVDREFDRYVCSDFDDKKYRFMCIEVLSEPDSNDDWIGIR